ncbi:hypothetical protein KFK09_008245 [Dendrobium nobile]|uniref:NAC domain-containing protein n=1 Tax=Dendrobium nobile TaxID=94219 RepID=A0A8T3BPE9_DENNO|nr:hypothetical protein KFK09_008245 [Dendrobium nobile]
MTWCSGCNDDDGDHDRPAHGDKSSSTPMIAKICSSCGHRVHLDDQVGSAIQDLPGLPAGVKFDPTDQELLEHLEGKARPDLQKLHPLIDEFIPTIDGENGICYTHPEKLPGVTRDGLIRHFFHRPSKAYTTGTRKRRKVHTDDHGGETRWHKTGKTRPVFINGKVKGYKKILVLYTNYGKQRKPEKTNWVMHQYHLGSNEEEKDGELVVSKVFYQTQPRQCGSTIMTTKDSTTKMKSKGVTGDQDSTILKEASIVDYYSSSLISYNQGGNHRASSPHLIPNFSVHGGGSSFLH